MGILANSNAISSQGSAPVPAYTISKSLTKGDDMSRTSISGDPTTWTLSIWLKLPETNITDGQIMIWNGYSPITGVAPSLTISDGNFGFIDYDNNGIGGVEVYTTNTALDTTAWYHVVLCADYNNSEESDRVKIYVNGVKSPLSYTTTPPQGYTAGFVNKVNIPEYPFGREYTASITGYRADIYFLDGIVAPATAFGGFNASTGQWQAIRYNGAFGANGYFLNFSESGTSGMDSSGNGNNFYVTGYEIQTLDVPANNGSTPATQPSGNYPVLDVGTLTTGVSPRLKALSGIGNTLHTWALGNTSLPTNSIQASMSIPYGSGKYYWEVTIESVAHAGQSAGYLGIRYNDTQTIRVDWSTGGAYSKTVNGVTTSLGGSRNYYDTTVLGIAYDSNSGNLWVSRGDYGVGMTWFSGNPVTGSAPLASGISGLVTPVIGFLFAGQFYGVSINFGATPFDADTGIPTGYKTLCSTNLPTPTIINPKVYIDTVRYLGNGTSKSIVNSAGFSPDIVWFRNTASAQNHVLYNSIRGVTKEINPNLSAIESTQTGGVTSFNSNGVTVGSNATVNTTNLSYLSIQMKAGTSTVANTAGSISCQLRAGATQGISISTYTGTGISGTVGHGLGVTPKIILIKNLTTSADWVVYAAPVISTPAALILNTTATVGANTAPNLWTPSSFNSSTFNVGTDARANTSGNIYMAMCFSEIAGFSKFGTFIGTAYNGSSSVALNFKPKLVMTKISNTAAGPWNIYTEDLINHNQKRMQIDTAAEATVSTPMFSGFGFYTPLQTTVGATYLYMAFADVPSQIANGSLY